MNKIKRYSGIIWLALGIYAGYFSVSSLGLPKFTNGLAGNQSDLVFGIIVLFILTPMVVGSLIMFGIYAVQGAYDDE